MPVKQMYNYKGDAEGLRVALIKFVTEKRAMVPEKGVAHISAPLQSKAYVDGERHAYDMVLDMLEILEVKP